MTFLIDDLKFLVLNPNNLICSTQQCCTLLGFWWSAPTNHSVVAHLVVISTETLEGGVEQWRLHRQSQLGTRIR